MTRRKLIVPFAVLLGLIVGFIAGAAVTSGQAGVVAYRWTSVAIGEAVQCLTPAELHTLAIAALYADRFPDAIPTPDARALLNSAAARAPAKPDTTDPACGTALSRLLTNPD